MNLDQRRSGILLHLTSLPGPHGIGDFGPDAFRFVDWLAQAGQSVWQWLPTTPIGPGDSPYQSKSAFAGSPLMVALEPLVERGWLPPPNLPADGFNAREADFAKLVPWRLAQLRVAAAGYARDARADERAEFAAWRARQSHWLDDYALFMAFDSLHEMQPWWLWDPALRSREPAAMAAARVQQADEIDFWEFVQWQFDRQCASLRAYANARGVHLMGDLPIFVADNSSDVWSRPDLYFLGEDFTPSVVAGVPPDELGPLGQRWGNPLYRWDRMQAEGFGWWTQRVQRALEQADVLRIDHFRGFAGYYEIAASSPTAKEGRWVPAPGEALFAAIAKALGPLPIVAEDLGLITPDVIALREGCGFPGMKILQFAFGGDGKHEFLPHTYARDTVVYTGTHDNETARGWWQHAPARQRHFAAVYLGCTEADVHWKMIQAASNSVANLAVFPLQDVLGLDATHRMNLPGTLDGNWRWRFDWPMLPADAAPRLGAVSATSGRAPIAKLG
ncbi:MAG: 4-alpha-glucanotransferase [Arenimonas sp.]